MEPLIPPALAGGDRLNINTRDIKTTFFYTTFSGNDWHITLQVNLLGKLDLLLSLLQWYKLKDYLNLNKRCKKFIYKSEYIYICHSKKISAKMAIKVESGWFKLG